MWLVIDASTLVAEAMRARGRALLEHPALDLVVAADASDETEHELRKRAALIVRRGVLDSVRAARLLNEALAAITASVTRIPTDVYAEQMDEARRRIPRDPRDAPTVALALALDRAIWTADRDFFGCGLPVWTTETLLLHLEAHQDA